MKCFFVVIVEISINIYTISFALQHPPHWPEKERDKSAPGTEILTLVYFII